LLIAVIVLAIDTSWKQGSVALARGDASTFELIEVLPISGGTFSAQLVPEIAVLLDRHGYGKQDLGGFAAAVGPGSFTGLRVGLAAVKGLAESRRKPIAAVSVLEAISWCGAPWVRHEMGGAKVAAALDAGRDEVFVGEYLWEGEAPRKLSEVLLAREEWIADLSRQPLPVLTCEKSLTDLLLGSGFAVREIERPGGEAIARIGMGKIARGDTVSVDELDANYLRRSDAELFRRVPST